MNARYVLIALLFTDVAGQDLSTDCASILSGAYDANSGKCMAAFSTLKTWTNAYNDCVTRGTNNAYFGRLLTQIDDEQWTFVANNFNTQQLKNTWFGTTQGTGSTHAISNYFWVLTPSTQLSTTSISVPSGVTTTLTSSSNKCLCANSATTWTDRSCTATSYYICEFTDSSCSDTDWSAWSACSQTCDQGIQNRYKILKSGTNCNSTTVFEYQSCSNGTNCHAKSSLITPLESECESLNGYYAYSTCYFLVNTTSDPVTACAEQNAIVSSFFGADLVSQLGSVFLSTTSVQGLTSLQLISGSLQWTLNGTNYPFQSNQTMPSPTQSCISLISKENSTGSVAELPHLDYTACNDLMTHPICMKSNHIYSSYVLVVGTLLTEQQSPEPTSYEIDIFGCGARCSQIISCLGFNYRSTDSSCIPTKVSIRTPSIIASTTIYTIQSDATWAFYDRI